MNLPADYHLSYTLPHEAWYWPFVRELHKDRREVWICAAASSGGVAWEFGVQERNLGQSRPALFLRMFDDAWVAFEQVPEFFGGLTDIGEGGSLDAVLALLTQLGAVDETTRTDPNIDPASVDRGEQP